MLLTAQELSVLNVRVLTADQAVNAGWDLAQGAVALFEDLDNGRLYGLAAPSPDCQSALNRGLQDAHVIRSAGTSEHVTTTLALSDLMAPLGTVADALRRMNVNHLAADSDGDERWLSALASDSARARWQARDGLHKLIAQAASLSETLK
jgi:hypothetical protein